jgi:predicted secreted protein
MNWISGIAIYLVVWWLALFLVLPWGVRPVEAQDIAKGHAAGAPQQPRLWTKMAVTSLVAAVLWVVIYIAITTDVIAVRAAIAPGR